MPIPLTDVVYPLDESGQSPSNRIVNERHELTSASWSGFNLIIPNAAPFFDDSIEYLTHYPSGDRLERGRDWITGYLFQSCTGELGKFVSSCIYFFDTGLTGQVEIPSYQCLGGEWQVNQEQMTAILAQALLNPQRYYWEYVANLPQIFRPLDHDQDIDEFSELGSLLDSLQGIANAIRDTPWGATLQAHLIAHNPHNINKDDVGLPFVNNWRVATPTDLTNPAALPDQLYITPPMVKLLIDNIAISALDAFKARRDNPNVVTAGQTGALTAAQTEQLIAEFLTGSAAGSLNAAFLEGRNYNQIIAGAMAEMENSLEDTKNQMLAQIQSILAGFQADDTSKFAGKTESEWDIRIVQFARVVSPIRRFRAVMDIVEDPSLNPINTVLASEPTHTLIGVINKPAAVARGCTQSFTLAVANTNVKVVLNQSTEDGVVIDYGTLPAGWQLYLDNDIDGNRRLWVTGPADRPAFDVFNMAAVDLTLSDGMTFYGASSANQFTHPGRFNLPLRRLVDQATTTSQIATASSNVLTAANQYTDTKVSNDLSAALATINPKINTALVDGQFFSARFTIPGEEEVTLSDAKIIAALHATGRWGTAYADASGTAGGWWNGKPHDINTLQMDVMVRDGSRYVNGYPSTVRVDSRTIAGDNTRVLDRVIFSNTGTDPVELFVKFRLSGALSNVVLP